MLTCAKWKMTIGILTGILLVFDFRNLQTLHAIIFSIILWSFMMLCNTIIRWCRGGKECLHPALNASMKLQEVKYSPTTCWEQQEKDQKNKTPFVLYSFSVEFSESLQFAICRGLGGDQKMQLFLLYRNKSVGGKFCHFFSSALGRSELLI